jgi:8-amino-7-oxononanoate synthase
MFSGGIGTHSLDDYVLRRMHLTGGAICGDDFVAQNLVDLLRTMYLQPLDTLKAEFERTGRGFVSFANYDYVGLANDLRIKRAACDAIMETGIGAGASRLVGGERAIHGALERDLAAFLGVEDTIALVSGYLTNVSLVGHLLTKNDLILVDELSHNSIMVGADISRAKIMRFAHNDLDHLASILKKHRAEVNRVLIIVEGLYSMDGDLANLPGLLEIRDRYGAWLLVDEAHSLGVLGSRGRGLAEHFGIDPKRIDMIVGTMSKTLGACGGFVAGGKSMIDWLRFTLPAFVFSVGIPPALAAAIREAIAILKSEPWRVARLRQKSQLFLNEAKTRGVNVGPAIGAGVISILYSSQRECMLASSRLLASGYYAPPILQLAVPKGKPRIRFFISALHMDSQIHGAIETLGSAHDEMCSRMSRSPKHRNIARRTVTSYTSRVKAQALS